MKASGCLHTSQCLCSGQEMKCALWRCAERKLNPKPRKKAFLGNIQIWRLLERFLSYLGGRRGCRDGFGAIANRLHHWLIYFLPIFCPSLAEITPTLTWLALGSEGEEHFFGLQKAGLQSGMHIAHWPWKHSSDHFKASDVKLVRS